MGMFSCSIFKRKKSNKIINTRENETTAEEMPAKIQLELNIKNGSPIILPESYNVAQLYINGSFINTHSIFTILRTIDGKYHCQRVPNLDHYQLGHDYEIDLVAGTNNNQLEFHLHKCNYDSKLEKLICRKAAMDELWSGKDLEKKKLVEDIANIRQIIEYKKREKNETNEEEEEEKEEEFKIRIVGI